jgi:hypothetical protein
MNLFNAARKICESFTYDPGHSDLDNEQPIAIHCTLGDWRRLNSALMLAGQRADQPEAAATGYVVRKEIMDFLHGIAPHPETGVWFGDGEETNKGRYWWRRILRDEIEQSTPQKETP